MSNGTSRYSVGIDLGTTNCALAYVDHGSEDDNAIHVLAVPQLAHPGEVTERPLLPSFTYIPGPHELPAGSLSLPWNENPAAGVGLIARSLGEKIPRRMVASAKSWLCHGGVDRTAAILPWGSEDDVEKISPLDATAGYLIHLREAWNHLMATEHVDHRLEQQEVLLTVPASFDAVARDLTMQAATQAGLQQVTLLEEPQAAFYAWLHNRGDEWREHVGVGDVVLVCDVGGGTTDFTLIAVGEEAGNLTLERLAVGDHILVGGDNMDLALAHTIKAKIEADGTKLSSAQLIALWHASRAAKEKILADPAVDSCPVTIVGRGSRLIGGTLQADLTRDEVFQVILDGFFPETKKDDLPKPARRAGLQELGLNYASDPAVPKHIAQFLTDNKSALPDGKGNIVHPSRILFNGGVLKAGPVQERIQTILSKWSKSDKVPPAQVLIGADLDLAVSRGAAYYGRVRRGSGVRIRGGTARSYYVGVESAMPAVPGMVPPIKALCVVPFGMEEGTEVDVPEEEFGLYVGEASEFRFLSSTHRKEDSVGTMIEDWESAGIEELAPLETTLSAEESDSSVVPVRLRSRVTELGMLELWCIARDGKGEWKLEFNVREQR
ncbi:Chaperone protein DnaK [Planctomycetes bacterium Pan216]|uniref:Chaperone protein DnaK n=1 Tax=Kolteria novifilia TaxID=2527975 RepID=A0A518B5H8_9BACT|nr:Chaperone protein DnaK [Planctomycetes bacterium Pan216]